MRSRPRRVTAMPCHSAELADFRECGRRKTLGPRDAHSIPRCTRHAGGRGTTIQTARPAVPTSRYDAHHNLHRDHSIRENSKARIRALVDESARKVSKARSQSWVRFPAPSATFLRKNCCPDVGSWRPGLVPGAARTRSFLPADLRVALVLLRACCVSRPPALLQAIGQGRVPR
jgi:hypothetical protein